MQAGCTRVIPSRQALSRGFPGARHPARGRPCRRSGKGESRLDHPTLPPHCRGNPCGCPPLWLPGRCRWRGKGQAGRSTNPAWNVGAIRSCGTMAGRARRACRQVRPQAFQPGQRRGVHGVVEPADALAALVFGGRPDRIGRLPGAGAASGPGRAEHREPAELLSEPQDSPQDAGPRRYRRHPDFGSLQHPPGLEDRPGAQPGGLPGQGGAGAGGAGADHRGSGRAFARFRPALPREAAC